MLQAAAQLQPHPYQAVIEPRQPSPLQGAGKQAAGGITATPEMGARGAGVATGERILATEDNQAQGKELKDGDISGIIQQTVDVCTDKFIDLVEDEQIRSNRRFGKSFAELEAKWEERLHSKQKVEVAKRKVADAAVAYATKKKVIKNWMKVADAVTAYVTRSRTEKKVKKEVAAVADAGTTCVTRFKLIFSFDGDPLFAVDINECWVLPSLADAGWFDEESGRIDEVIHAGVHHFDANASTAQALEL